MKKFYLIRIHFAILVCSLVFLSLSNEVMSQLPFNDCFESGNLTTGGWNLTGDPQISTQSPFEGSYCVEGTGTYNIEKTFTSITDNIVTVEYAMKASQTGSNCVNFTCKDQNNNYLASVFFRHTGQIVAYNGSGSYQDLMPYNADTWYEMKIVLKMSDKKYDVIINGQLLAENYNFVNSNFTTPIAFSWGSDETWGTGWVDCVHISSYPNLVIPKDANGFNTLFYPNPTNGHIIFNKELINLTSYKIINTIGGTIIDGSVSGQIDISGIYNGIYFIEGFDTNGNLLFVQKLIKQ